jgi:hypothetical protein
MPTEFGFTSANTPGLEALLERQTEFSKIRCRLRNNRICNHDPHHSSPTPAQFSAPDLRPVAHGQTTTLPDLLAARDQWPDFAAEGKKFQFEGRFEGRAGNSIKIIKFDISCNLPANGTFPDNIKSGQRIDIIGRFLSDNGRLTFVVSRILIKDTDTDKIRSRAQRYSSRSASKNVESGRRIPSRRRLLRRYGSKG